MEPEAVPLQEHLRRRRLRYHTPEVGFGGVRAMMAGCCPECRSPNNVLQPTANPLRGLSAAELGR